MAYHGRLILNKKQAYGNRATTKSTNRLHQTRRV